MNVDLITVVRHQAAEMADEVGRLRRRIGEDEYGEFLLDQIAGRVEVLDQLVQPTAAELFREFFAVSGNRKVAVEEALRVVDARVSRLRSRLGVRAS